MKSLRQLAKEIGVSAAYLSQVNHGKVKMSPRVAKLLSSVNQNSADEPKNRTAGVAELADAEDLKSSALKRLVGSRPSPGTRFLDSIRIVLIIFFVLLHYLFLTFGANLALFSKLSGW